MDFRYSLQVGNLGYDAISLKMFTSRLQFKFHP